MDFEMNFGRLSSAAADSAAPDRFRIVLLGDFSGRAAGGTGNDDATEIGRRRAIRVDVDDLDGEVERLGIELTLDIDGGTVVIPIGSMDDFHPDEIVENVDVFEELLALRRRLDSGRWESAAAELGGWEVQDDAPRGPRGSDGTAVPIGGKLGDFASLIGGAVGSSRAATDADDLVQAIVAPFVVDARDPKQDELIATVDEAIAATMRSILHHPHFRAVESSWRTVEWLVRNLETSPALSITLHDMTAGELAADLASEDDLAETGMHHLLIEGPSTDAALGRPSLIVGLYIFEQTPPHAELLGRIARLAAASGAPFVTALGREVIRKFDPDKLPAMIVDAWAALRAMPEAAYLGLTTPRFLLRPPYGKKSDPCDAFDFEEFTRRDGLKGMLWGNGAALAAHLLGANVAKNGANGLKPDAMLSVGDMPFHWFTDDHGDQIALPCSEMILSERMSTWVSAQGAMPVLAVRGRPEVRLGGFRGVAGGPLAGPWAPVTITAGTATPVAAAAPAPAPAAAPEPVAASVPEAEPEPAEPTTAPMTEPAADDLDDLDALLASLGGDDDDPGAADDTDGDEEMDPELAALLADL